MSAILLEGNTLSKVNFSYTVYSGETVWQDPIPALFPSETIGRLNLVNNCKIELQIDKIVGSVPTVHIANLQGISLPSGIEDLELEEITVTYHNIHTNMLIESVARKGDKSDKVRILARNVK